MDSLLASYGSDEEDADSPSGSPKRLSLISATPAVSESRHSIFASLPPPKNSAADKSIWGNDDEAVRPLKRKAGGGDHGDQERTAPKKSFFASLPPPKNSAPESAGVHRDGDIQPANGTKEEKKRGGSLFAALPPPRMDSAAIPSDLFQNSLSETRNSDHYTPKTLTEKSSPLIAQLPPPASSKSLFGKLPLPSTSRPPAEKLQKKLVEFKPPVNYSLLETTEEDDLEHNRKHPQASRESEKATESKGGGLAALLPPPKNKLGAGAALGGGGAHGGRRAAMETLSDPFSSGMESNLGQEATSSAGNPSHKANPRNVEEAELNVAGPALGVSTYGLEPTNLSSQGSYVQYNADYYETTGDPYVVGNEYDQRSWQYPGASAFGAGSQYVQGQGNVPVHGLAEVLKKERRKGRDEPPLEMIEVKQADLTGGSKLRDDQLHTTGIAFGPSYQPVSSNKDKPSKIHRRKHQIGALYFDMKQNEMNLLDRRSKGSLTKAETQAKYGW